MNKYIICNYYRAKNSLRQSENIFCLQKNLNLSFIKKIFVFCDFKVKKDLIKLKNNKKIVYINTGERNPYLKEVLNFCGKKIPSDSIIIILNLDIYLQNSSYWKYIDKNFFNVGVQKKTLVCIRENINEKKYSRQRMYLENLSKKLGDFSDCWVFKNPIDKNFLNENVNFPLWGTRGSDSLLMGLMCKHFHTYSWGTRYKISHLHTINENDDSECIMDYWKKEILKKPLNIKCLIRMHEAARIPTSQNFEQLLQNKIKPKFYMVKKNQNSLKIYLRIIYFTLLKFLFFLKR
jgi:hypothetical protein